MHAELVKFPVTSNMKRMHPDSDSGSENAVCLSYLCIPAIAVIG